MTEKYNEKNSRKNSSEIREKRRERYRDDFSKDNSISWGSIIAGAVSFAAVFTVLSLIVAALGLGIFSPNNENPISSMGIGVGISTVIILIISFGISGFISGAFSKGQSLLHGFMSWALSIILLFGLVTSMVSSALGLVGSATKAVANTAGDAVGTVASTTADGAGNVLSSLADSISGVDTKDLEKNINDTLSETDVKELQPEYLKNQLDDSKNEILEAGKKLATNPEDSDKIFDDLSKSLEKKAKDITDSVDKKTIKDEVYKNSSLSAEESDKAVDNIYDGMDKASKEASKQIENAKNSLEDAKKDAKKMVKDAKDGAESATNKASVGAVLVFLFLLVGLAIEIYCARMGERYVNSL
ncbi:TIGR04086 family membrane protein [Anaerococcus hydrogenalis]|uniref:TIGR04086 family membrane protein n=1 Tax=Anaerococcus hydrogenalis TaxID=33029 RepID=UPI0023F2B0C7|nr:hypothetical protein [Anaerococcus hydrogenalis]